MSFGPGRLLGLDFGTVRIGVAVSDSRQAIASPLQVIRRGPEILDDYLNIHAIVQEYEVVGVVVGLPLALSGRELSSAMAIRQEVVALSKVLVVPVEFVDERLSSVEVQARRQEMRRLSDSSRRGGRGGVARTYRRKGTQRGPQVIDDLAASIILQSYLDRHHLPESRHD